MNIGKDAIISLCASTLTLIVFGSIYTFGALTPYISSYLYYKKDETSSTALSILFTLTIITINVGIAICTMFLHHIPNRLMCIVAIIAMSASVLAASFMTQFVGFIIFYGFCYGFSIGIGYFPPLKNCYMHLPKHKGLCAGVCMSGFGLGSAVFNYIIVALINPDDVNIDQVTKKYPEEIANNLPHALQILAAIYAGVGLLGAVFVIPPKENKQPLSQELVEEEEEAPQSINKQPNGITPVTTPEDQTFSGMWKFLKSKRAYFMILQFGCIAPFGMFTAFNYKRIAFDRNPYFLENDHLVTTIGSIGIICNGLFRSAWGVLFDHFSFRKLTIAINVCLLVLCGLILFAVENVVTYFIIIPCIYLSYGGVYALLPTQSVRVLGPVIGSRLFWLVFSGLSLAAAIQFVVQYGFLTALEHDGYYYCIGTFFLLEIIGLAITLLVHYDYEESENHLATKVKKDEEKEEPVK